MIKIKEITDSTELKNSLKIIRKSFATVAAEQNLTRQKVPGHSAFLTWDKLLELQKKATLFGLFLDGTQVGFVGVEKADTDGSIYYMDKLAVLPEYRHKGYGRELVNFAVEYVKKQGGSKVSLGMIDSQTVLKQWYISLGFKEMGTKKFEHLPFIVRFMDRIISS